MRPFLIGSAFLLCAAALPAAEIKPHDAEALSRADASVAKAIEKARQDRNRPAYHIAAPGNWINDPNGPVFHNGYWHMFYQHNPYGDGWGHMHWGHVRSRDLAHWEHLPIALWPSKEAGEEHVFSGCAAIRADGTPLIFYTSIHAGKSATDFAEQWLAIGNKDLTRWEKSPRNPVLALSIHGETKVWDWRDPFLFKHLGQDYMVLGGHLREAGKQRGSVFLYKAKDVSLESWEYLGVLFTQPDAGNIECPNFFPLQDKWVLIVSPHRRVEYFVGDFDGKKFTPAEKGLLDHSNDFYAPNCTTDKDGNRVLWGWVRNFKDGQGWNGCLTLPRKLSLDQRGKLRQDIIEPRPLRTREIVSTKERALKKGEAWVVKAGSSQFEIHASFVSGDKSGIRLPNGLEVYYENAQLRIGDRTMPHVLGVNDPFAVSIYVDHSVVEVVANGSTSFTKVQYSDAPISNIEFFTGEPKSVLNASVHELGSAWTKDQPRNTRN